eukprot:1160955-Pelagomonas_calceolata.AAC.3
MDSTVNHITPALLQLTTSPTDKLETHVHKRHKLNSAGTSGYYYSSWQGLNYAMQPTPPNNTVAHKPTTHPHHLPSPRLAVASVVLRDLW